MRDLEIVGAALIVEYQIEGRVVRVEAPWRTGGAPGSVVRRAAATELELPMDAPPPAAAVFPFKCMESVPVWRLVEVWLPSLFVGSTELDLVALRVWDGAGMSVEAAAVDVVEIQTEER